MTANIPAEIKARRKELAQFLRVRRSQLSPIDVGLEPGRRRRVPGLRRDEVAALAHISATWYTWLEQARDVQASAEALDALARALRLNDEERQYLRNLAGQPIQELAETVPILPAELRSLLNDVVPSPACVVTRAYKLVGWNEAFVVTMGDPSALPERDRNLLQMSTADDFVDRVVNWSAIIDESIAHVRMEMARRPANTQDRSVVSETVAQHPFLRRAWERSEVRSAVGSPVILMHPVLGQVCLQPVELIPVAAPRLLLLIARPTDERSQVRLRTWVAEGRNRLAGT